MSGKAVEKGGKGKTESIEHSFPFQPGKGWKNGAAIFSKLGFDSVSSSQSFVRLRKVQSADLFGKPHLMVEIELRRDRAILRYTCLPDSDRRARQLSACLLFAQALSLLPGSTLQGDALAGLFAPSLEHAQSVLSLQYESLSKKNADLSDELSELSAQNRRLLRASEEASAESVSLSRQVASLRERVSQLERMPEKAIDQLLLDHLSTHRGSFNLAQFSRAHGIPVARCEERLAELMRRGAIRKVAGSLSSEGSQASESYQAKKGGIFGLGLPGKN